MKKLGTKAKIGLFVAATAVGIVVALLPNAGQTQGGLPKETADLKKPFAHDSHLKLKTKQGDRTLACSDCHQLGPSKEGAATIAEKFPICGNARMPFPTHEKCTACHPTAFFVKPLVICTNCHVDVNFTAKSPMKDQGALTAPLKTEFSHKLHLNPDQRVRDKFKLEKDCTFCHSFAKGGEVVELPNHPQCCECHTLENVEPNIINCATCHARPKNQKPKASMIKKFSHADHKTDPVSQKSLPCVRCHSAIPKAETIMQIDFPVMATCVDCHTGEAAFDYTQCLKCHGPDIASKPAPDSHKKEVQEALDKKKEKKGT